MQSLENIREIINKYEVFILDQWGVIHDGNKGYSHAIKCINYLKANNKKLIIISNSSKRKQSSINRLTILGFDSDIFDEVITRGEMIWQAISLSLGEYGDNLKKCFHIFDNTKEDGIKYRDGLKNVEFVNNIREADYILACTPYQNSIPIDYIPILNKAYKNKIPMFCANPDFETVEKVNKKNIFCMGTIAQLYQEMGGNVIILGKPSQEIYHEAIKCVNSYKKSQMVAVGDSLFHDILGAKKFGIDNVLITSGIHADYFAKKKPVWESKKNQLLKYNIVPTYLSSKFIL